MPGRKAPRNDPGADVNERFKPVRVKVVMQYFIPNRRSRVRGERDASREEVQVHREIRLVFSKGMLDPETGPALLAAEIANRVHRRLKYEGYPEKQRDYEQDYHAR